MSYIVVTPARNEESFLLNLSEGILNQSLLPAVWIIVDDNSTDNTGCIADILENKHNWIKKVRINRSRMQDYAHERYAEIVRIGFASAIEFCKKENIKYEFLAIIDADIEIEQKYFEKIINFMNTNRMIGIGSGIVYEKEMTINQLENQKNGVPRGAALVFKKECYEMIGGFSGHSNSFLKARNRNWRVETFASAKAIHKRTSWSRKNYSITAGEYAYFLNYHPVTAFLSGFDYVFQRSPTSGFYYLLGYFSNLLRRQKKIDDEEIRNYYWGSFVRMIDRILQKGIR